ncbi:MAG: tetratricopeptide repeat protein [Caldilineaceae bacterium]
MNADNWQDVVQICWLSAGLPLAIELAAAQVKLRTCAAIRQTLAAEPTTLATKYYDIPERHRSLNTVLNDSWQLLTDPERTVLAATSVFVESFSPEAATAVAGATLAMREELYDKSMLQRTSHERYHLHSFVQQFAGEQLQRLGKELAGAVRAHHGRYYLQLVRDQREGLYGATPQQAIYLLQQDLLNIEQAWQWAVAQQNAALLVESSQGLIDFHLETFLWTRGKQLLTSAVAMVQMQLAAQTSATEKITNNQPVQKQLALELATLLCDLAQFLINQNAHTESIQTAQQALGLAATWSSAPISARGNYLWGLALTLLGDHTLAEEKLTQALALARTANKADLLRRVLLDLGNLLQLKGDHSQALAIAEEALQLSRTTQMLIAEQRSLMLLGDIYRRQGNFPQAQTYFAQALALAQSYHLPHSQAILLTNLGIMEDNLGHYRAAQRHYTAALQHYRQWGHRQHEAQVLGNLGISADYLGDYGAALRYSQECLQILQALKITGALPTVLVNLALHAHHLGDQPLAQRYGREALTISAESDNRPLQSYAWTVLGHAALGLDKPAEAETAYTTAIDLAHALAMPFLVIEPLAGLVRVDLAATAPLPQLRYHVQELLTLVTTHGVEGLEEPFRVYLTCYEGLRKLADPRAIEILRTAYGQLLTRSAEIDDDDLRASFLTQVAANRALVQAATTASR